ncbi:MAG TPA: YciI family protein [Longimicrobiales bacterium]
MMIVKASEESEQGQMPTEQELREMGQYNEQLVNAGVMLAGEGLHASSKGARVRFSNRKPVVVDGPFAESKELIAGFWIIDVASREEAIEWARRVPFVDGEIELRQIAEAEDFGEAMTPDLLEQEKRLGARMKANAAK